MKRELIRMDFLYLLEQKRQVDREHRDYIIIILLDQNFGW